MEPISATAPPAIPTPRRRPWFLLGVVLFLAGPIINAIEISMGRLQVPWYLLVLTTAGVALMSISVWQRRGVFRIAGLLFFTIFCAGCWFLILVFTKAPPYTGPATPGKKVPAFTAALADGKSFTDQDLADGKNSVLLFFRGRW